MLLGALRRSRIALSRVLKTLAVGCRVMASPFAGAPVMSKASPGTPVTEMVTGLSVG
ncbi:hypothetical protein D3C85_1839680 [compost metagenome]